MKEIDVDRPTFILRASERDTKLVNHDTEQQGTERWNRRVPRQRFPLYLPRLVPMV